MKKLEIPEIGFTKFMIYNAFGGFALGYGLSKTINTENPWWIVLTAVGLCLMFGSLKLRLRTIDLELQRKLDEIFRRSPSSLPLYLVPRSVRGAMRNIDFPN